MGIVSPYCFFYHIFNHSIWLERISIIPFTVFEVVKMEKYFTTEPVIEYDDLGFVKGYSCSQCGSQVKLNHVDDVGTTFFKCEKCGQTSAKLKPNGLLDLEKIKDSSKLINLNELGEILGSTIKRDEPNKIITFLCMTLNYTNEDQTNLAFNAESSTGKSYIPLELAWYFPKEDVMELGYVSPQAFFHEHGTIMSDPTDMNEDEEKRHKIIFVDLEKKIIIFIDQPHDILLQRLRPLLSHDRKEIISKITDKREKSGTRTKTVHIIGYPSVLFCTSKFSMNDQERTRLLLLSPETTQEKIKLGILLKIEKESNRQAFKEFMESDSKRVWLKNRVQTIKEARIENILILENDSNYIAERFLKERPNLVPRHQRDITRLLSLIKAHALLNLYHRERTGNQHSIIATREDIEIGFNLYKGISEANELGLPPEVYEIYDKIVKNEENGFTRKELANKYFAEFHKPLNSKRQDEILMLLNGVGLTREEPDPDDRRRFLIYPQVKGYLSNTESLTSNELNTPQLVGETKPKPQEPFFHHCFFCQEPIMTDDWVTDEFTNRKPAHPECYEKQILGVKEYG